MLLLPLGVFATWKAIDSILALIAYVNIAALTSAHPCGQNTQFHGSSLTLPICSQQGLPEFDDRLHVKWLILLSVIPSTLLLSAIDKVSRYFKANMMYDFCGRVQIAAVR
jgi:hypothetical protein